MPASKVSSGLAESKHALPGGAAMTPQKMHQQIKFNVRWKKYYSITNLPPWAGWQALPKNQQMETRPCFNIGSRIHTLSCGHTVAVPRDAEPCAANCAGNHTTEVKSAVFSVPVPTKHVATLETIRRSIVDGVNAWAENLTLTGAPDVDVDAKANVTLDVLKDIWTRQETRIRPKPDLISGDFSCPKCGMTGHRPTFPTFTLPDMPYACIVVGREEDDVKIIEELEKGVSPKQPEFAKNRYGKERKRSLHPETWSRVRHGRIVKHRVEEKKRVTEKLRQDSLLDAWGDLGLGDQNGAGNTGMPE